VKEGGFVPFVCLCLQRAAHLPETIIRPKYSRRELNTVSSVHCEKLLSRFWLIIWDEGFFNLISDVNKTECMNQSVHEIFMKRDEACDTLGWGMGLQCDSGSGVVDCTNRRG
jgi:hypothetical protein